MFRKLKDKLADEVKANPRLQGTLDSVNQLAVQTYSSFTKEGSGSRDSLTSLSSQLSNVPCEANGLGNNGASSSQSDLVSLSSPAAPATSVTSSSAQFFSLGEDDEPISLSNSNSPLKTPTPATQGGVMTSTPNTRSRRLSNSSQQDASLFPIWEDPDERENVPLFSDMESCAGSEAGWDDSGSAQLGSVSKEHLFTMLSKMRARYHKYKGRYADLSRAYRDLEAENRKVKEVMQQTQDRALRRIGELREQVGVLKASEQDACMQAGLEKQAKAHLEEELRAELEEKEHIIVTLNTKVSLLKEATKEVNNGNSIQASTEQLVEVGDNGLHEKEEGKSSGPLEEKVKRLESLLSKCKENIKANKQKMGALTEVKEQLATDLALRESELAEERRKAEEVKSQMEQLRGREAGEELQMAEVKLAMHKEMLEKDEEITDLRSKLGSVSVEKDQLTGEVEALKLEVVQMGKAQDALEARMEEERKSAMEELSRGKEAALEQEREQLKNKHSQEVARELSRAEEQWGQRLKEVEENGRLEKEELELRLAASQSPKDDGKLTELAAEVQRAAAKEKETKAEMIILQEQMKDALASREKNVENLKNELFKVAQEKDKEVKLALESMAKLEAEVALEKKKVEVAESKLAACMEDHRLALDNLSANYESGSSEVEVVKERLKTELAEKESEVQRLLESVQVAEEAGKELQERLDINLDSSMKNEEEYEQKISTLESKLNLLEGSLKESEENLSSKAEELRDANEKVEDLQNCLEQMQSAESKLKEIKDLHDQKVLELRDANEELEEFKRIADERGISKVDLEKELIGLREQVNSRQALHDQMVGYEKELHSRISNLENEGSELKVQKTALSKQVEEKVAEIEQLRKDNEEEKLKFKQDREMKIMLEREKETAQKEFQRQSIEYEKQLQDQLEENNQRLTQMKEEISQSKKSNTLLQESYERDVNILECKLSDLLEKFHMSNDMSNNMSEKCDLIENILHEKEKLVTKLEGEVAALSNKVQSLEREKSETVEERKQLNKIIEDNQLALNGLKNENSELEKMQMENKKLSKSRDRLKSLLDEKEKKVAEIQDEKERAEGSQEQLDQKMKERVSTLMEEVAKTSELKDSLQCEVHELRNNLENVTREVADKAASNDRLAGELAQLQNSIDQISKDKNSISDAKQVIEKELEDATKKYEKSLVNIAELEKSLSEKTEQNSDLAKEMSVAKISQEEINNLRLKVKQMDSMNNCNELKEENALLTEKLNQLEEEKVQFISSSENFYEAKWSEEKETLEVLHTRERKSLEKRISSLEDELKKQTAFGMSEETESKVKSLVKEMERKMARMEAEHEEELEQLREAQDDEMGRLVSENRLQVNRLNSELRGLEEQLELREHEQEASIMLRLQEATELNEAKLQEVEELKAKLVELEEGRGDWDRSWEEGESYHQLDGDSPAIFGVPQPAPHPSQPQQQIPPARLEEYPEFEYLRNILFQYMCGRQPLILVKVLSAIVKFTPEQVEEIMRLEERKQSYLPALGLS